MPSSSHPYCAYDDWWHSTYAAASINRLFICYCGGIQTVYITRKYSKYRGTYKTGWLVRTDLSIPLTFRFRFITVAHRAQQTATIENTNANRHSKCLANWRKQLRQFEKTPLYFRSTLVFFKRYKHDERIWTPSWFLPWFGACDIVGVSDLSAVLGMRLNVNVLGIF